MTDVKDLREGCLYYVLAGFEEIPTKQAPSITTMEQFFEKLKVDRKRSDSEINNIKEIFSKESILFDDLIETGELAMTDVKLEKCGISRTGLRTAILAVIKSDQ